MSDYKTKQYLIIEGIIIISIYFIFWVIVTVLIPIISVGLRIFPKEPQKILDDPT